MTKISSGILLFCAIFSLSGCEYFRNRSILDVLTHPLTPTEEEMAIQNQDFQVAPAKKSGSVVVCRSHQCAPAKLSMSKEYIYNSLLHLFDNNNYQTALVCQADAAAHTCLENYITLPIMSGITPTNAYIDQIKITDVIIGRSANKINLVLNYNLTYGGQNGNCTPSKSILFAKDVNHILLEDAGYNCKMTTIGQSTVKTVFAIDYIDLDYGYIGGHYSIGISGPAYGGGNGYMLLRLPKNAYPLAPQLQAPSSQKRTRGNNFEISGSPSNTNTTPSNTGNVQVFPINK